MRVAPSILHVAVCTEEERSASLFAYKKEDRLLAVLLNWSESFVKPLRTVLMFFALACSDTHTHKQTCSPKPPGDRAVLPFVRR
jgi:hypothetical protein